MIFQRPDNVRAKVYLFVKSVILQLMLNWPGHVYIGVKILRHMVH